MGNFGETNCTINFDKNVAQSLEKVHQITLVIVVVNDEHSKRQT